jgi:phosphotransferase system enzyme I (PtsI)
LKAKNLVQGLLKGIPVSEGIAIGKVSIVFNSWDEVVSYPIDEPRIPHEIERYRDALGQVSHQLLDCRNRVLRDIGKDEAKIFDAHLTILNDPFFQTEIPEKIRHQKRNAEALLKEGIEAWIESFRKMENEYFRARIEDIKDVAQRTLKILLQSEDVKWSTGKDSVLVSHNLTPSETARMNPDSVIGFATELGGATSHVSILARSMGLPAVVGVERLMRQSNPGQTIIVDGNSGIVYLDPPNKVLKEYEKRKEEFAIY